jgi:hypothetical protein
MNGYEKPLSFANILSDPKAVLGEIGDIQPKMLWGSA